MSLDTISAKRCNALEQEITQILRTMRSAGLQNQPLYTALQEFEQKLADIRRNRYDQINSDYSNH